MSLKGILEKVDMVCHKIPVLGRIWHEILFFVLNAIALFGFKDFITNPALQLLSFKMLLINAGVIHATITRKWLFPYINFKEETDTMKKLIVVVIYVMVIYAYSHGG